jgi:dUTP pyrophosphatase
MTVLLGDSIKSLFPSISPLQLQPAGIDLTVEEVFTFTTPGVIDFDNKHRAVSDCSALQWHDNTLHLKPGAYKLRFAEVITIPPHTIALAFPRSSLLRSGATLHHAVWDPGYEGKSESLLVVHNPHGLTLYKRARVAQLIYLKLEKQAQRLYRGVYHKEGV